MSHRSWLLWLLLLLLLLRLLLLRLLLRLLRLRWLLLLRLRLLRLRWRDFVNCWVLLSKRKSERLQDHNISRTSARRIDVAAT